MQLLQLDPLIERVNAELTAGSTPGNNILQVTITESPALHTGVSFANNQSTSVGSEQGSVFVAHDNLLGLGDKFNAEYAASEGLDIYNISYAFPFNALDGTIGVRYSNSVGTAWNNRGSNPNPQNIASLGLGLNWQPYRGLLLRADYGIPFVGTSDRGNSLQDNGFNFSVRYQPF